MDVAVAVIFTMMVNGRGGVIRAASISRIKINTFLFVGSVQKPKA